MSQDLFNQFIDTSLFKMPLKQDKGKEKETVKRKNSDLYEQSSAKKQKKNDEIINLIDLPTLEEKKLSNQLTHGPKKLGKVIVVFGPVGAGKSRFSTMLKENCEGRGLSVYFPTELSLRLREDFKLFNSNPKKYAFHFQDLVVETFAESMDMIEQMRAHFDVLLIERTNLDTKIFTNLNIDDPLKLEYLNKKNALIPLLKADYYIYVRCEPETCVERQQKRKREGENYTPEYVKKLCREYDRLADELYPDRMVFDSNYDLEAEDPLEAEEANERYQLFFEQLI
jgi:deoxyadenosine/deoxycytidine kinase